MILGTYSTPNRILAPKKEIPCKTTYLLKENFLSEYMTNSEKEKVLKNLGILGEDISFNTSWDRFQGILLIKRIYTLLLLRQVMMLQKCLTVIPIILMLLM